MPGPVFHEGEQVELRPVEPADHDFLLKHGNSLAVRRTTNGYEPLTRADIEDFQEADDAVRFLVCTDGEPVGSIWLFWEEQIHGRAEVGYWIAEDAWGNGYATEALELLTEYATTERRLRRLTARVFEGNEASKRVLEKAGFEQEGRLRDHYYVDGEYLDATLYGWLAA